MTIGTHQLRKLVKHSLEEGKCTTKNGETGKEMKDGKQSIFLEDEIKYCFIAYQIMLAIITAISSSTAFALMKTGKIVSLSAALTYKSSQRD